MAESDEEYNDRRRGTDRDKFRRERNDYDRRDDRRAGREWQDRREDNNWNRNRDRREYDFRRGRDRYSPMRHMSPPMKRMRRESQWGEDGGGSYSRYGGDNWGGGPMHGGPPHHSGGWGGHQGDMPPPNQPPYGNSGRGQDSDYPSQPAMMTFKQFLSEQDDNISDEDAIKKFNEYKLEFKKQQISEFFLQHKEEEWFKAKYHPDECGKKKEDAEAALRNRRDVFIKLLDLGLVGEVSVDLDKSKDIIKLLDAAVILMEGGTEKDLEILDMPEEDPEESRYRRDSESKQERSASQEEKREPIRITFDKNNKRKREESLGELPPEMHEDEKKQFADMPMSPEPESPKEKTEESPEQTNRTEREKKKRHRNKSDSYSYSGSESSSGSDSGSESESESDEAGAPVDEPPPPGMDAIPGQVDGAGDEDDEESPKKGEGDSQKEEKEKESDSKEREEGEEEEGAGEIVEPTADSKVEEEPMTEQAEEGETTDEIKPRPLHRTASIFLRNLAPTITKQEVEALCKRYPSFLRVALQDPQPERRFFRRGWLTFDNTVNIKEICWNLNNIRLRDCEMGAIVNRELKQRVRPAPGVVSHKQVAKQDIKHCAKIIQAYDKKWRVWEDENEEKKDIEKQPSFGLVSKNPVLKNITDYLVDEGSYEEDLLLGEPVDDKPKESNPEFQVERDEELLKVLDRMILYLRIVHSLDYYSAVEYPNEDEMPHRCGIMHARGPSPPNRITQNDINEWVNTFEHKITGFFNVKGALDELEAIKLGKKDPDTEVEKFVKANTQELAKDKWLCPISGKKFKGPEFVRKHIFSKQADKVDEVKKEVTYFNNYLMDSKRPQLPDHPANTPRSSGPSQRNDSSNQGGGSYDYGGPPQAMMGGGYNQGRPPTGGGYQGQRRAGRGSGPSQYQSHGGGGNYGSRGRDSYRNDNRREAYGGRRDRTRQDPRGLIEYRDLDAPDEVDIF